MHIAQNLKFAQNCIMHICSNKFQKNVQKLFLGFATKYLVYRYYLFKL